MRSFNEYRARHRATLRAAVASALLISTPYAFGQSVGATLRGQVTAEAGPASGATVTATNTATGLSRSAQTSANGTYSLAGLPPGEYRIEVAAGGGTSSQIVLLQVGQTATLDLQTGATPPGELESVTVTAQRLFETKTSEVATYVSLRQIEALPQSSRNFLEFADTIPGVQFIQAGNGSTEIRSGAQSANGVNVFIDGVGQKNYVSRGGVGGQGSLSDSGVSGKGSRGNPFPQLAIGEYKVITSNYKAEFDQLSSAAIVAATKSGTNQFELEGFWDFTNEDWRASDPFEARDGEKAASEQEQYGLAVGGPIIQDRMHFFVTYERKNFESPRRVFPGSSYSGPLPARLQGLIGNFTLPFEEDLVFAKIDWTPGDAHLIELSAKLRDESELVFGESEAPEHATDKKNEDARYDLRYQYTGEFFLNDMHITYEDSTFSPRPLTDGAGFQNFNGATDAGNLVLTSGAGDSYEDRSQKGYGFQNDTTFNAIEWFGTHTLKAGVKFKKVELSVRAQTPYNPIFALDINDPTDTPWRVRFGAPLPFLDDLTVKSENKQYGIYLQDDWDVTDRLQLNLGLRYDYEETPGYLDYVTPSDIVAAMNSQATNPASDEFNHPAAPAGMTYAQLLALGGLDINQFISTGNNRDAFDGGIQPRLGFSYDLTGEQRHVIFGGAGRAYDRNVFEYLARETFKGTYPTYERAFDSAVHDCDGPNCIPWDPMYFDPAALRALVADNPQLGREVFMLKNDLRTPYSDQYSLGMRNRVMLGGIDWNTSATFSYIKSEDGIAFLLGCRWGDGTFREPGTSWDGQPWGFRGQCIPGIGQFLIGTNGTETRARQILLSAEKPYSRESGWSATFAYTFTDAKENRMNIATEDATYMLDYPTLAEYGWHVSTGSPKHRLVATGIFDAPWGLMVSAKLTLATPLYYQSINCMNVPAGQPDTSTRFCRPDPAKPDHTLGYKRLDLALQKQFTFMDDFAIRLRADVLNVFNSDNIDTVAADTGTPGAPNTNFLQANSYLQPTRTLKLSLSASFR